MKKNKKGKYKEYNANKIKFTSILFSIIIGIISFIFLMLSINNILFVPATLITFAMLFFCLCYYYLEIEYKKNIGVIFFILGILLILIEVFYTLYEVTL